MVADADEAARAVAADCHRREGSVPESHPNVAALGPSDPEELAGEVLCLVMVKRGRVSRTWRRSPPPPASTASSLVIADRDEENASAAAERLGADGGEAVSVQCLLLRASANGERTRK
jgi:hypothetical protein